MTRINTDYSILPIFMFGMERSGTTLLSMMVGSHPEIAVPHATSGMWFSYFEKLQSHYNGLLTFTDCEKLLDDVLANERIRLWGTALDRDIIMKSVRENDFPSIIESTHKEYARKCGKPFWANIDIATLDNMHIAYNWFPSARFLHIVRDGRDVALSHQTMPYGAGNIEECASAWANRITTSLRMGDILGPSHYMVIHYEDLILKPRDTLSQICEFFGISYSDQMLNYSDAVKKSVPKEKIWLWPDLKKPPQISKVDRWKKEMRTTQRIVFERAAGSMLKNLGYDTYDQIPKTLSSYLLEFWYFLDRGNRLHRIGKKIGISRRSLLERQSQMNGEQ